MRVGTTMLTALVAVALAMQSSHIHAQSALEELEKQAGNPLPPTIGKRQPPVAPVEPSTAPAGSPRVIPGAPPITEAGYLGLFTDDRATGSGVPVVEIERGGPAEQAGLRTGDRIVTLNGKAIRTNNDVAAVLTGKSAGQMLTVGIIRGGAMQTLQLILGAQPPADSKRNGAPASDVAPDSTTAGQGAGRGASTPFTPSPPAVSPPASPVGRAKLGVSVVSLDSYLIRMNRLPLSRGAFVNSVQSGSIADQNGLRVGDVIVSAAGRRVNTAGDIIQIMGAVRYGREVEFLYYRGNRLYRKNIRFPQIAAPGDSALGHRAARPVSPAAAAEAEAIRRQVISLEQQIQQLKTQLLELDAKNN